MREFRDRGVDILGICGGDGSDHCTLTAVDEVDGSAPWPLLLPLRAGTINYVADDIGGRRGTPEQVLQRVVHAHRNGHPHVTTERDVLRVNGDQLGFVLSFGTAVNFLRVYYARETQGPLWAAGGDRGLYKTLDGGATWKQVLAIDEHTGVSDIAFDPRDPDVVYAAPRKAGADITRLARLLHSLMGFQAGPAWPSRIFLTSMMAARAPVNKYPQED